MRKANNSSMFANYSVTGRPQRSSSAVPTARRNAALVFQVQCPHFYHDKANIDRIISKNPQNHPPTTFLNNLSTIASTHMIVTCQNNDIIIIIAWAEQLTPSFFETFTNCHIATLGYFIQYTNMVTAPDGFPLHCHYRLHLCIQRMYAIMNTLNVIMVTVPMSFPLHCHYLSHLSVFTNNCQQLCKEEQHSWLSSSHSQRPCKQLLWASHLPTDESLRWSNRLGYDELISFLDIASQRNLLEKLPSHPTILVPPTPCPTLSPTSLSSFTSPRHLSSFTTHLFPSIPVSMGRSTNSYATSENIVKIDTNIFYQFLR